MLILCKIVCAQILVLLLYRISETNGLFVSNNISASITGNISCHFAFDYYYLLPTIRNVTELILQQKTGIHPYCSYCIYEKINTILTNGTIVNRTVKYPMHMYHAMGYKRFITERCSSGNFQPSVTLIGYGLCTRLPYEASTSTLCICSTDNCNYNYTTCVASVQASQSSPPPIPASYIPELTNIVSCQNGYQGATYMENYFGNGSTHKEYTPWNMTVARAYRSTVAVACVLYMNQLSGDWYQVAVLPDEYGFLLQNIKMLQAMGVLTFYAESSTSVSAVTLSDYYYSPMIHWLLYIGQIMCFCTTNDCNQNFSTCAIGFTMNGSSIIHMSSARSVASTTSGIVNSAATSSVTTSLASTTTRAVNSTVTPSATSAASTTSRIVNSTVTSSATSVASTTSIIVLQYTLVSLSIFSL